MKQKKTALFTEISTNELKTINGGGLSEIGWQVVYFFGQAFHLLAAMALNGTPAHTIMTFK